MKTSDISMESTTPTARLRRAVGVVDEIEMSDGLSVHCVDTTDVVAVDTAHTKDVLSADATDFMSAHTTQSYGHTNKMKEFQDFGRSTPIK